MKTPLDVLFLVQPSVAPAAGSCVGRSIRVCTLYCAPWCRTAASGRTLQQNRNNRPSLIAVVYMTIYAYIQYIYIYIHVIYIRIQFRKQVLGKAQNIISTFSFERFMFFLSSFSPDESPLWASFHFAHLEASILKTRQYLCTQTQMRINSHIGQVSAKSQNQRMNRSKRNIMTRKKMAKVTT